MVARLCAQQKPMFMFLQQPNVRPVRRQAILHQRQRQVRMLPPQIRQQTRLMRPARSRSWSRKEQGPEGCLSSGMAMPLQFG